MSDRVDTVETMAALIEREAVKRERARIRAAVEGLPRDRGDDTWDTVPRAAVLELLEVPDEPA